MDRCLRRAVLFTLLGSAVLVMIVAAAGNSPDPATIAPFNQQFVEYRDQPAAMHGIHRGEGAFAGGAVPSPVDLSHLRGKHAGFGGHHPADTVLTETGDVEPSDILLSGASYDLRDEGRVSPVKHQGSCGSCWAFATYGSLESFLLPDELYDFSENNLKNTHGFDLDPCSGGNAMMAAAYLARGSGPVDEADDPYDVTSTESPAGLSAVKHVHEILFIPGREDPADNANLKQAISAYGALYSSIYWSDASYDAARASYYYAGSSHSNHAITLVGWDDAYDRTAFASPAPGDGAFIARNSWGSGFGDGGYFVISYYDAQVGGSNALFTGDAATTYDRVYGYDPLGWTKSLGTGSDTASFANVYTAGSAEYLTAVGFYIPDVDTTYEIAVYLDPDLGPIAAAGPIATISGGVAVPGYHTVVLDDAVPLEEGQRFSVTVRLQTSGYRYPVAIESPVAGYASAATAGPGESYVLTGRGAWTDLTSLYAGTNACLKAYTRDVPRMPPDALFAANVTAGDAPLAVQFTDMSTNEPTSWFWDFGDGTTSAAQHPQHTYESTGTYTVALTAGNAAGTDRHEAAGMIRALLRGDLNENGYVDIGDATMVTYMAADLIDDHPRADFNGNGYVDVGDAARIRYYFVGLIDAL
ncbi:MAG: lectin like domain-containing protein [Methanomicrobiaceae archaeon]|nr:lectin like domain-containing protein [Methanomicrobiaceae archaeon]